LGCGRGVAVSRVAARKHAFAAKTFARSRVRFPKKGKANERFANTGLFACSFARKRYPFQYLEAERFPSSFAAKPGLSGFPVGERVSLAGIL
jgi:hypothetical protein